MASSPAFVLVVGRHLEAELPRQPGRPVGLLVGPAVALAHRDGLEQAGVDQEPRWCRIVAGSRSSRSASSLLVHSRSLHSRRIRSRNGLATALICAGRRLASIGHPADDGIRAWKHPQSIGNFSNPLPGLVGARDEPCDGRERHPARPTPSGRWSRRRGCPTWPTACSRWPCRWSRSTSRGRPPSVAGLELVRSLPWLLGSLPIGALIDRLDRRRTMVWANAARATFVAVPAGGHRRSMAARCGCSTSPPSAPAWPRCSTTPPPSPSSPRFVPRPLLDRANGRLYAVELGAQEFAGPPIGGVLVAVGAGAVLRRLGGAVGRGPGRPAGPAGQLPAPTRRGPGRRIRADVREGLSFLLRRPRAAHDGGDGRDAEPRQQRRRSRCSCSSPSGSGSAMGLTEPEFGILVAVLAAGGLVGGLVAERVQRRLGRARHADRVGARDDRLRRGAGDHHERRDHRRRDVRRWRHHHAVEHHHRLVPPAGHARPPPRPGEQRLPARRVGHQTARRRARCASSASGSACAASSPSWGSSRPRCSSRTGRITEQALAGGRAGGHGDAVAGPTAKR